MGPLCRPIRQVALSAPKDDHPADMPEPMVGAATTDDRHLSPKFTGLLIAFRWSWSGASGQGGTEVGQIHSRG